MGDNPMSAFDPKRTFAPSRPKVTVIVDLEIRLFGRLLDCGGGLADHVKAVLAVHKVTRLHAPAA
jgi:hypothetical protein